MLRIIAAAASVALTGGMAGAQGLVPGAAPVEGYHERFVNDSTPERLPPPSRTLVEEQLDLQLGGPGPALPVMGIDRTVVMSPVPAAIPEGPPAATPGRTASPTGLTPGAPLGSDPYSDSKAVVGGTTR
jgi:hypothetical protein